MLTGPGSHFSRARSSRQTIRHIENRAVPTARERRPILPEQRPPAQVTSANGPEASEGVYYEAMTVGTTQVNGGTAVEGMHHFVYQKRAPRQTADEFQ